VHQQLAGAPCRGDRKGAPARPALSTFAPFEAVQPARLDAPWIPVGRWLELGPEVCWRQELLALVCPALSPDGCKVQAGRRASGFSVKDFLPRPCSALAPVLAVLLARLPTDSPFPCPSQAWPMGPKPSCAGAAGLPADGLPLVLCWLLMPALRGGCRFARYRREQGPLAGLPLKHRLLPEAAGRS